MGSPERDPRLPYAVSCSGARALVGVGAPPAGRRRVPPGGKFPSTAARVLRPSGSSPCPWARDRLAAPRLRCRAEAGPGPQATLSRPRQLLLAPPTDPPNPLFPSLRPKVNEPHRARQRRERSSRVTRARSTEGPRRRALKERPSPRPSQPRSSSRRGRLRYQQVDPP